MKLISLNLEGKRHLGTALPFLEEEKPDCVALMEVSKDTEIWMKERGYHTTVSPMTRVTQDGSQFEIALLFGSLEPHTATSHYYYHPNNNGIIDIIQEDIRGSVAHPIIFASVQNFNIAATHFTWNPQGEIADINQKTDLASLLSYLKNKPPHILCGDFNIPRHLNSLYNVLIEHYKDAIPAEYKSSLDKNLHRLGNIEEHNNIFNSFMVDYVFTQPPYSTSNTRLEFGISDHAAIVTIVNN